MSLSWLFLSFEGRINRAIWWMVVGATLFLELGALQLALGGSSQTLAMVISVAALLLRIAPSAKRLHDRNKSAIWVVVYFGTIFGLSLYTLSLLSGIDPNNALVLIDSELANTMSLLSFAMLGIVVWVIVDLGIAEGTRGDNKYGPDPLAGRRPGGSI